MFRSHHQAPADDTALTPPSWGLNNSGGTGVNRGASKSNRAGSLPSSPISATVQGRADYRGVEQLAARRAHNPEVVGSSPTPATTLNPDEGSAAGLPAICRAPATVATPGPLLSPFPRDLLPVLRLRASLSEGARHWVDPVAGDQSPEPCDRAVRRSARRLSLLGSRGGSSHACRLPGSARPMVDGTRPADDDDVLLATLCGSALVVVGAFLLALVVYCW